MNLRARFYLAMLVAMIVIGMHQLAFSLYLYWIFKPIDIFMHIFGGFMSALFVLVFLRFFHIKEIWKNVAIGVIIVGISWEALEIFYKVADFDFSYWVDSFKDMIDDLLGGYLGLLLWRRLPETKTN